jgi:glyoxylase-like metal-dependent hydrolase (beta-lactamase superfamily II)
MRVFRAPIVFAVLALAVLTAPVSAQTSAADRDIARMSGDLYRVREGSRYTVFLVTSDGIILGDPLSSETAIWLKDELNTRFPGRAVRFVLLTHHHFDRAEGTGEFPAAVRVAHRAFSDELSKSRQVLPSFGDAVDSNHDGVLDEGELANASWTPLLLSKDRDGDGRVTPGELYRRVQDVKWTYDTSMNISLGGRTVRLVHPGKAHSADMSVLFFPSERIVFAVDPPPVAAVPFEFGPWRPSEIFNWIHAVAALDFDTVFFGDGTTLSRAQLQDLARYLDALREEVSAGYEQGWTASALQARRVVSSSPYASARAELVDAIYRTQGLTRLTLDGSGGTAYEVRDTTLRYPAFCGPSLLTSCRTGGAVAAGTGTLTLWFGGLGVGAELQMGAQLWNSRTSPLRDDEFAWRETRMTGLVRYSPVRRGLSYAVSGGVSFTIGDSKGAYREKEALLPIGGTHALTAHDARFGLTGGIDLTQTLGSGLAIIVPIRVTNHFGPQQLLWPSNTTMTVGAGLSVRLARRVY